MAVLYKRGQQMTVFKGPTICICYRRISVIANIEIKENPFKGPKDIFYRQIFITGGSVRGGDSIIANFFLSEFFHSQILLIATSP